MHKNIKYNKNKMINFTDLNTSINFKNHILKNIKSYTQNKS